MMIIIGLDVGSLVIVTEIVGAIDGADEGLFEFSVSINNGLLVGSDVGCGIVEGVAVDMVEGTSVGSIVGGVVGSKVGFVDGIDVGKAEGSLVGT